MKIIIETIPHSQQRYDTCGDWQWEDENTLHIKVSNLGKGTYRRRSEQAIIVHELVEAFLCKFYEITQEEVDEFDIEFLKKERRRSAEPGDSADAPYAEPHSIATAIERILVSELCIPWCAHEEAVNSLVWEK